MARTKKSASTAEEGIQQIMSVELLKTIAEGAEFVGLSALGLQELFSRELNSAEPMGWDVIPQEYEHLLNAFKAEVECIQAEAPVLEESEPEASTPTGQPQKEPPMLEEEPEAPKAKKGATPKQKSGALTKTRKAAIEQAAETVKQSGRTHELATSTLAVQKGTRKGAKLAALELQAEDAAYEHVKRQGLQRKIAKLQDELLEEENFDPNELLTALGVPTTQETQAELDELVGNVLGKLQTATTEILDNSWANGYDLDAATLNLDRLMNSYE